MKRCVVIGLGIFGLNIVRELSEKGFAVIAIDKNKESLQRVRDLVSKAIVADGTDKEIMDQIGVQADDTVIISFGEDLAAATLITLHLKQLGVGTIIVKAPNEEHKMILEKVGATDVIIPEKEMATKVARSLISPNMFDYLPLSEEYMISEMAPAESFLGRTLAELQLRTKFNVMVIAVKDLLTDKVVTLPPADFMVRDGQVLIVVGKETDIGNMR
jgi:trk system potassium uptake protein TrkA